MYIASTFGFQEKKDSLDFFLAHVLKQPQKL